MKKSIFDEKSKIRLTAEAVERFSRTMNVKFNYGGTKND